MNSLYFFLLPLALSAMAYLSGKKAALHQILALASLFGSGALLYLANQQGLASQQVSFPWITSLGITFSLAINGLNYWFLALNALVCFIAVFYHVTQVQKKIRQDVVVLIFGLQAILNGVFMAQDLMLFYFLFEASILPIYFISSRYGSPAAERATLKFFLYTLFGSLFMLLGILYLYAKSGANDFLFTSLFAGSLPGEVQGWLFLAFFLAFAIKMPLFPFHSWQVDAYSESPVESTILMSGILLKMGIYGMLVIVLPNFPLGLKEFGYIFMALSAFGVVYGAMIAMVQYDFRKVLAYSSLSHVGLIGCGILAYSDVALEGVILQMFAHGVNIAGLFFVSELIASQAGTRDLDQLGGLTRQSFGLTVLFFIFLLGSIAVPLTNGFPGEFQLLMGLFGYNIYLGIFCGLTVIFSSVYMIRLFQKSMLGKENQSLGTLSKLNMSQTFGLSLLAALVLGFGLFPDYISQISNSAVQILLRAY
jgi:NADH-quinone oxidoreductase subunit M